MRSIALALLLCACDKPSAAPAPAPSTSTSTSTVTAPTPTPTPAPSPAPSPSAAPPPLPSVKIANIGMHIGGGPNDAATKDPIAKSVEPHFDEFRRCFALVDDPKHGGDFGVDILIEPDGGKAKVTGPRTRMKGNGFEDCVVKVFAGIEFLKPRFGKTMVSYSLQFTP